MDYLKFRMGLISVLIHLVLYGLVTSYQHTSECNSFQTINGLSTTCRFSDPDYDISLFNFSVSLPQNTTELVIKCNIFTRSPITLQPQMFKKLYRLEEITISDCYFDYKDEDVFAGLSNLKKLSISNAFKLSIHPKTFLHVPNLEILKILNCSWHGLSPNSLCMLSKIHTLDFSKNQIRSLSEALGSCEQSFFSALTALKLDFNQIKILESHVGKMLTNLMYLSLKGNKIEKIQNGALANFSQLRYLDVSHNNLTQLPNDFLSGCSQVYSLIVSNNFITKLPLVVRELKNLKRLFADNTLLIEISLLEQISLIKLKIHNSSLITIPPSLCRNNSELQYLDLGQNSITKVPPNIFKNCTKLEKLDLSSNNILTLFNESFKGLKRLNTLILSNNNISSCGTETFLNMENLKTLDLDFNSLSKIPIIPENLETINITNNQIRSISNEFSSNIHLEYLYIGNNCIQKIEDGAFRFLRALSIIDLKKNNLTMLNKSTFKDLKMLFLLDISYNKIADIHEVLYKLRNLRGINAQHNLISKLQPNTFPGHIVKINLAYNRINEVEPGTFENMTSLSKVDLRVNRIVMLNLSSVRVSSKYSKFYISGNPFQCDCKLAWLKRDGIKESKFDGYPKFQDLGNVTCLKHGKHWLSALYNKDICQKLPVQNTILVYGLTIGLVLIVAVFTAGTILFMYRIEIQILIFIRFGWRIVENRVDEEDKMYDAFVSFHSSQDDFVVYEMLPQLEGTNPAYKLCLHFRDFAAGEAIVDNITGAIANSKRTILLLNDQFLTSEWCRYEFQAAHYEALSNKLNTVILVLLEDINPDLVDGGLKLYMKTKTYLRYDDPRFWDKLRFALPAKKEETPILAGKGNITENEEHSLTELMIIKPK